MDISKEIVKQIESIQRNDSADYLDAVYTHLLRAEFYYDQGANDGGYYNDVIYRSNQAYEGILKESFKILAAKSDAEVLLKSPNEIERFFESNNIFRERVLQLFRNYRQEWRNKSTHNHQLSFDESEAFLALTAVNSFVHLLLKQIQERIAFNTQQKELSEKSKHVAELNETLSLTQVTPIRKLEGILAGFLAANASFFQRSTPIPEIEVIGKLDAYLRSFEVINIEREPKIHHQGSVLRPDFIIKIDTVPIVLECNTLRGINPSEPNGITQLLIYMKASNIAFGVLFDSRSTAKSTIEPRFERFQYAINETQYRVSSVRW